MSYVSWLSLIYLLQMLTGNHDVLCGGKVVVFGGDMGQVLPVIDGVAPRDVLPYALPSWEHWSSCQRLTLSSNMRAAEDAEFAAYLGGVRDGSANIPGTDEIVVPPDMLVLPTCTRGANSLDLEIDMIDKTIDRVNRTMFYLNLV